MKLGLTLPNAQWRVFTDQELAALDNLAPSVIVWLLYGYSIDQLHAQQLAPFIAKHNPRILYRPYRDDIPMIHPADWAADCAQWIQRVGYAGELIPANEQNLAVEHGSENWARQIDWLKEFAREWRKHSPSLLHLPALSPSGRWLDGLRAYHVAGLDQIYDRSDAHGYGPDAAAIVAQVSEILLGPLDVTEFNAIDPLVFAGQQPPCESATWFLLGGTPDQGQYDLLKQPDHYASFKAWRPTSMADFDSPNHDGPRAATVGVVLHATFGPSNSPEAEYSSTINYFANPASQVSAHAVVGPGGKVHRPVRTDEIAWHCRASNKTWLGIEMAHPFSQFHQPIGSDILDAAAKVVAGWCHDYEIPLVWSTTHGLAEHHEMPTNTDGHRDVGGPFDRADFLARVKRYSGQQEDGLTDQQKAAVLDHLNVLWGETRADTIKANPAESERACHERIIAIKVALGLNR